MTAGIEVLNLGIVRPFVGHIHGGHDWTPVGVLAASFEELLVQLVIEVIHRVIKGEQNQLGSLTR